MTQQTIHIIFDAARATEANLIKARELNQAGISLYKGLLEEKIETLGPFIFPFKHPTAFSEFLTKEGWGYSWGIFAVSALTTEHLFHHFRQFLVVKKAQSGEELYFRFYDPRVLRAFLPTCDIHQLKSFFDAITYLVVEDENPEFCLKYSLQNQELKTEKIASAQWFKQIDNELTAEIKSEPNRPSGNDSTTKTSSTNSNNQSPPNHSPWID